MKFDTLKTYTNIFKDKQPEIIERFITGIGISFFITLQTWVGLDAQVQELVIEWNDFLKINALLRFYTADLPDYVYFWLKVIYLFHYLFCIRQLILILSK